jgi:hypothetical protein
MHERNPRRRWPRGLALLLAAGALGLAAAPAHGYLRYTLGTELKTSGCTGDTDSDCLDNGQEGALAWAASPWYFYDEDEDCSGWKNRFGLPSYHFARQDFFQVRPVGNGVRNWSPTDGLAKWVRVTYFLNFPHDCKNLVGIFGGHQGDSERIRMELYSYDLRTWYLYQVLYAHHDNDHYFSGSYLESRALSLGTSWISVAADEDSHGSWPGREPDSSHCAGSEDDFCAGTCDCFQNTWRWDFNNGWLEVVAASRNVGGPSREAWNPAVVTVSGADAYTALDVGHGANPEYWSPKGGAFGKFCGWECPAGWRTSDGSCLVSVHDRSGCSSALSTKVDTVSFNLDNPSSCVGNCGGYAGACYCDSFCVTYGDCCPDACAVCGYC